MYAIDKLISTLMRVIFTLFVSEYVAAIVATHGICNIRKASKDEAEARERESILIASEGFEVKNC